MLKLLSSLFLLAFAAVTLSTEIFPYLRTHEIIIPQRITLGCYVLLPPNTAAPRKIFIETYGNSALITRVSFHTNFATNVTCTSSLNVDMLSLDRQSEHAADYILNTSRYEDSHCFIDGNGIPSREIIIQINPVTNFDLTRWRCVVEMSNGMFYTSQESQGNLLTPYGIYHHSQKEKYNQHFDLGIRVLKSYTESPSTEAYIPLVCSINNSTNISEIYAPNLRHFPTQPWKTFRFKFQTARRTYSIETDMYGRIPGELKLPSKELHESKCSSSSPHDSTCLNMPYMLATANARTNPLLDSTTCFNFTLIAASNLNINQKVASKATFVKTLFDFGADFDRDCKFEDQTVILPRCLSYPKLPAASIEIKDKIILEVPTASNYHCFPLFNTHMSYILRTRKFSQYSGYTFQNLYTHHISLCPDVSLIVDLYKEVIEGMKYYRYMEVKYIEQPSINYRPHVALDCGKTPSAKLIYISSGSCSDNKTLWCGKQGGEYSVKSEFLEHGRVKIIKKKARQGKEQSHDHIMNCMWRMYFCFTGRRKDDQPPSELVLVENKLVDLSNPVLVSKYTGYNIHPNECPHGERFLESIHKYEVIEILNMTINTKDIADRSREQLYNVTYSPEYLHVQKNVSIDLLNDMCPCRTRPSICTSNTPRQNIFSMDLLMTQIGINNDDTDPVMWCEAFDQKSKRRNLSELVVEHLCTNEVSDKVVRLGARLLPKPFIQMHTHTYSKEHVIISCNGIPAECLSTTSPIVSIAFWNSIHNTKAFTWTMDITKVTNESSEICIATSNGWKCNDALGHNDSGASVPPQNVNNWPVTSVSLLKSFLSGFTHMKCSYALGIKQSETYNIKSLMVESLEQCRENDYKMRIVKRDNSAVACEVSYFQNGGICNPPPVTLTLTSKDNIPELTKVTCIPSKSQNDSRCSLLKQHRKVSAILFLEKVHRDSFVSCSYMGTHFVKMVIPYTNISNQCINEPTVFVPVTHLDYNDESLTITCKYPDQFYDMCADMSYTAVNIMLKISSIFEETQYILLATRTILHTNSTCLTTFDQFITCNVGNPPNMTLLEASVPYTFPYLTQLRFNPYVKMEAYCKLYGAEQNGTAMYLNLSPTKHSKIYVEKQNDGTISNEKTLSNKTKLFPNDTSTTNTGNITVMGNKWANTSVLLLFLLIVLTVFVVVSIKMYPWCKLNQKSKAKNNSSLYHNVYVKPQSSVRYSHENESVLFLEGNQE